MTKLPTKFASPEESPGLQLWRVTNLWQREMRRCLLPYGLTHVQFVLLAVSVRLGEVGAVAHQAEVAAAAGMDKMMTSQVLRALEHKGLITRTQDPDDQRAITVTPTEAGVELVGRAIVAVEEADARFFGVLDEDSALVASLLVRLGTH